MFKRADEGAPMLLVDDENVIASPRLETSMAQFHSTGKLEGCLYKSKHGGALSTVTVVLRYFVLEGSTMHYSKKKGMAPINSLDLKKSVRVEPCNSFKKYFGIRLVMPEKEYYLWCTNHDNRELWLAALCETRNKSV